MLLFLFLILLLANITSIAATNLDAPVADLQNKKIESGKKQQHSEMPLEKRGKPNDDDSALSNSINLRTLLRIRICTPVQDTSRTGRTHFKL